MKEYLINNAKINFDDTKKYFDYAIKKGNSEISYVNIEKLLDAIVDKKVLVDDELKEYMIYLQRWKEEAPLKRSYRELVKEGVNVLSSDNYFLEEGGLEIIQNLENTGLFADYFLKTVYKYEPKEKNDWNHLND